MIIRLDDDYCSIILPLVTLFHCTFLSSPHLYFQYLFILCHCHFHLLFLHSLSLCLFFSFSLSLSHSLSHSAPYTAPSAPIQNIDLMDAPPVNSKYIDIPNTNMRKIIAKRLTESKATVPHFYTSIECEIDELMALRANLKKVKKLTFFGVVFLLLFTIVFCSLFIHHSFIIYFY